MAERWHMMKVDATGLEINGVRYVRADSVDATAMAPKVDGLEYCIVRTYSAGVFAGYVKLHDGKNAVVLNARRLWYWAGAASISQLAMEGTAKPTECKFPCKVNEVRLSDVVEVIPATETSRNSIEGVKEWKS